MKLVFSSKEYPAGKRFEAWRTGVCERYVIVDMVNRRESDYVGYIKSAAFGPVTLSDAQAPPEQHIIRRSTHVARAEKDCYYLGISVHGSQEVEQEGGRIVLGAGKAALFSASRPYELRNGEAARTLFLEFATDELRKRLDGTNLPTNAAIHTGFGIGKVAAAMCIAMATESETLSDDARAALGSQVLSVLSLAFQASEFDPSDTLFDADMRTLRLQQIKRYIDEHLSDQLLNPDRIARANNMSVRSLHYLFKSADMSVSDHIWAARLERCRRELELDAGLYRTITDIAMDAGFNSLSHFSSVFRKKFGMSPSDVRGSLGLVHH
jgi:AraC-like DNA-binding protein